MGLDLVLLLFLAFSVWKGWKSGAVAMILSLIVLLAAAVLASAFATQVGEFLKIGSGFMRPVIGFFFTFVALLILGSFITRVIRPKHGLLRGLDGIVGAVVGGIRGIMVLGLLLVVLNLVHLPPDSYRKNSRLYEPIRKTSTMFVSVLKPLIMDHVNPDTDIKHSGSVII